MVNLSFGNYAVDMRLDDLGPWQRYIDQATPVVTFHNSSSVDLVINPFNILVHATGHFDTIPSGAGVQFLGSSTLDGITITASGQPIASVTGLPSISFDTFLHLSSIDDLQTLYSNLSLNITGSPNGDYLIGESAADMLSGGNGNDTLDGGAGNDMFDGGAGNDTFIVDAAGDTITDSSGTDTVQSYIPWILQTGLENLTLIGSAAYGVGNSADNMLTGNDMSNPLLRGEGGNDVIAGGGGNDWIEGDNATNMAVTGNDTIDGGDGNDTVLAGPGDDMVHGGNGTDTIVGDDGNDLIYGDAGIDYLDGRAGADQLFGGDGNDVIYGDNFPSTMGFAGDTIHGDAGDDILMGESDDHGAPGAMDVIYGDAGNDTIYGGGGNDWILGGDGNDVIDGGAGSDYIVGGPGADIMVGSGDSSAAGGPPATAGGDLFAYMNLAEGGDRIYGFDMDMAVGTNDGIDLRAIFDLAGYGGTTPRADAYLYVFQNNMNTDVYVDANGPVGGANLTHIATLVDVTAPSLTDSYFLFQ